MKNLIARIVSLFKKAPQPVVLSNLWEFRTTSLADQSPETDTVQELLERDILLRPFCSKDEAEVTDMKRHSSFTVIAVSHSFREPGAWEGAITDGHLAVYALSKPDSLMTRRVVRLLHVRMDEFRKVTFKKGRPVVVSGRSLFSRYYNIPFCTLVVEGDTVSVRVGMHLMERSLDCDESAVVIGEKLLEHVVWTSCFSGA